jgi:hypothetical protein
MVSSFIKRGVGIRVNGGIIRWRDLGLCTILMALLRMRGSGIMMSFMGLVSSIMMAQSP